MALTDALNKLAQGARNAPHDYVASVQTFAELDVDRIAKELRLVERGQERGSKGEPKANVSGLDDVEREIVDKIERERRASHNTLLDQIQIFQERIAALDFESRFAVVKGAAVEAVAEFRVEANRGRDRLFEKRRQLAELEQERDYFKTANRLKRTAKYPSGPSAWLKWGVLILLVAIETVVNGSFLARGSEMGFVGGTIEALGFASLNILASALITHYGVRQLGHRRIFRKLIGFVSLLGFLGLVLTLNLALAHYREAAGLLTDTAGVEVINRLTQSPFDLAEIKSWLLFGLGVTFAFVAFIDVLLLDDLYPGYGKLERHMTRAIDQYRSWKEHSIDELSEIRDQAAEALQEATRDLSVRRAEHDSVSAARSALVRRFELHVEHLTRAGNELLSTYRDANVEARKGKAPKHFQQPFFKHDAASIRREIKFEDRSKEIHEAIAAAQATLSEQLVEIHNAYLDAVREYDQIEIVVDRQLKDGETCKEAA